MATEDFRRIVESLKVPVALADSRGTITFANEALAQLTGGDAGDLVGRLLAELFRGADQRRAAQAVARVAEGKAGIATLDAALAAADLSDRWVHATLQPVHDGREKIAGVALALQDIGAQRETDAALNLLTARLIALAEHSPVATLVETGSGDVEIVNGPFCALLGLESAPQSLSGLPVKDVLARSERLEARAIALALAHPEEPSTLSVTGEHGLVQIERQPIVVEGEPGGAIWIGQQAAAAGEAVSKAGVEIGVIERIGEELSVALEGLAAVSILAEQINLDPAIVERFHGIHGSTETALTAIGDLVDFSRVSGGVVLHRRQFGLRESIARLVERIVPVAEEHGCRLRIKVEQDVADALEGDVERLQLVLRNLVDNAFALLPGAEILLQITPEYATASTIQLSFSVIATGSDIRTMRGSAENGMGVAVARFMVRAMGGALAIGGRAPQEPLYAFTVEFPLCPPPPGPRRATYVSLVGLTVMVVSDDPQQRLEITNLVRGWRMVPVEADNAPMALALLERLEQEGSPVPLVILSNRLPVQDGFLLSYRIKHHPRLRTTLTMMLATEGKPGDAMACRENGIAAYMRYPINDRQLNEAIVAVTGASIDADETPTLVTRHSLREQRKGATILLVDASRDSQILAAHVFGRHDCAVVVAQDLAEALAALDQDVYDVVIVDTGLPSLDATDLPRVLRSRIQRDAQSVQLIAASSEHSEAFHAEKRAAGFDGTLAKPFRREELFGLVKPRLAAATS